MLCSVCGADTASQTCKQCGAKVYSVDAEHFPAVTWGEVREHLIKRLFIDDEWRVDEDEGFVWFPWFLEQQVFVTAKGLYDDDPDDNYLKISATTPIAEMSEELGIPLCAAANAKFSMGSFMWVDGAVVVTTSLVLNPLNRGLLALFHNAILAQATVAHEAAIDWEELDGVSILASEHPTSGPRLEPDELLNLNAGDAYSLPEPEGMAEALKTARIYLQGVMMQQGWQRGYSAEDVDFFDGPSFDLAVGVNPGAPQHAKFGAGLIVMTRMTMPDGRFDEAASNAANVFISRIDLSSQLGCVVGGDAAAAFGSHLSAYLPMPFLGEYRENPHALAIHISNAVNQCAGTVAMFWQVVEAGQN